jgi:hypothetical protein
MNTRQPTLIEVLFPRCFPTNPVRTKVTRTILQPEIDQFEKAEAAAMAGHGPETRSVRAGAAAARGAA